MNISNATTKKNIVALTFIQQQEGTKWSIAIDNESLIISK